MKSRGKILQKQDKPTCYESKETKVTPESYNYINSNLFGLCTMFLGRSIYGVNVMERQAYARTFLYGKKTHLHRKYAILLLDNSPLTGYIPCHDGRIKNGDVHRVIGAQEGRAERFGPGQAP